MAVDADAHEVIAADDFKFVPLAVRVFDFVRATETFDVLPRVPSGAVESSDGRAFADAVDCQIRAIYDEDVAGAAFNHLALNRFWPDLIASDEMDQDAAVAGVVSARCPGFFTPFEFGGQFVVGEVGLFRRGVTKVLAGDVELPVFPIEDVVGIFIAAEIAEERVEVLRLEQVNDVVLTGRCTTGKRE